MPFLQLDLRVVEQGLPPLPDVERVLLRAQGTGETVVERLRTALFRALSPS